MFGKGGILEIYWDPTGGLNTHDSVAEIFPLPGQSTGRELATKIRLFCLLNVAMEKHQV
jgi:hypothetical protein